MGSSSTYIIYLFIKNCPEDDACRYCFNDNNNKFRYITIVKCKTDEIVKHTEYKWIECEDSICNEYFKIIYNLMSKIIFIKPVGSRTKCAIRSPKSVD